MKVAYLMMGLPGSGKSTLIKEEILKKIDAEVVSSDDFIQRKADLDGKTYNEVFEDTVETARVMMWARANQLANDGKNIVWDQTLVSTDVREEVISFLKEKGYMVFGICLEVTEENMPIIQERNLNRKGKEIPEKVLWSMFYNFERPTKDEGFNMITYIDIGG